MHTLEGTRQPRRRLTPDFLLAHTLSPTSRVHTYSQLASKFVRLCLQMWFHLIAGLSEAQ